MTIPQYSDCPGLAGYNSGLPIYTEYTSCEPVKICWTYDPEYCDRPAQGFRVFRTTTPPVTGLESLCVSIGNNKILEDKSKYNNTLNFYSDGALSPAVFNSHTPYGVTPIYSSINFDRAHTEYYTAGVGNHYDLSRQTFTLDIWVGNKKEAWLYYFPCQTIVSCFDAANNHRSWRLYFEPTSVTNSQGSTSTGFSVSDSTTGSLVLELYENGDGSGSIIKHVIMSTTSNPDWKQSFTGTWNRFGYGHICINRVGELLKVYVDGGLKATINVPFNLAYDNQQLVVGRHFGNSGRLDPARFAPNTIPANDGDESHYNGRIYDIRLVTGLAITPPPGGRPPDVCSQQPWYDMMTEVAVLPFNKLCWEDKTAPVGSPIYYRVASVNCDVDINSICPAYIAANRKAAQQISSFAVDNPSDLAAYMNAPPITLLDIFNTWDRMDPSSSSYFPGGVGATGNHAAWYYSASEKTFIQPENSTEHVCIVSPPNQYMNSYTHDVIVTSDETDDDAIGSVGMFNIVDDQQYAMIFTRTCGGDHPFKGWGVHVFWGDLGSGFGSGKSAIYNPTSNSWETCGGYQLESLPTNPASRGFNSCSPAYSNQTDGWSDRQTRIEIVRNLNVITARASPNNDRGEGGKEREPLHILDDNTTITINLYETPPPFGMPGGWGPLQGKTGYGFMAHSQRGSKFHDWYLYPEPWKRIFDFTNGAPGEVWEFGLNDIWYKTIDTVWEVVDKTKTVITDFSSGQDYQLDCDGSYSKL